MKKLIDIYTNTGLSFDDCILLKNLYSSEETLKIFDTYTQKLSEDLLSYKIDEVGIVLKRTLSAATFYRDPILFKSAILALVKHYDFLQDQGIEENDLANYLDVIDPTPFRDFLFETWSKYEKSIDVFYPHYLDPDLYQGDDVEELYFARDLYLNLFYQLLRSGYKDAKIIKTYRSFVTEEFDCSYYHELFLHYAENYESMDIVCNILQDLAPRIKYIKIKSDVRVNGTLVLWNECRDVYAEHKGIIKKLDTFCDKNQNALLDKNDETFFINIFSSSHGKALELLYKRDRKALSNLKKKKNNEIEMMFLEDIEKASALVTADFIDVLPKNYTLWKNSPLCTADLHETFLEYLELLIENDISYNILQSNIKSNEAGRNDQCPCGSGKKFKKCCLS